MKTRIKPATKLAKPILLACISAALCSSLLAVSVQELASAKEDAALKERAAKLRADAIDYGLLPLPRSQKDADLLIKSIRPDAIKYEASPERIELGKQLYFDPRLSKSGIISCNTCHNLGLGGVDGVAAAVGHKWTPNPQHLNSPTVYNSAFNLVQFWDGRAAHLAEQAQGPIQAGPEMAAPKELIEERIASIPGYVQGFAAAFGKEKKIDFELIADTIAIFEHSLFTPAPFDDFLEGRDNALSSLQQEGLELFLDKGCAGCHNGVNLGGTMQGFELASKYEFASLGGFAGDKDGMVKAPTLRNVAETAPYFHNGGIWSLKDAVKAMGSVQLGIKIEDAEADKILAFLGSLTGAKPDVSYPQLPISSDATPKPDFN